MNPRNSGPNNKSLIFCSHFYHWCQFDGKGGKVMSFPQFIFVLEGTHGCAAFIWGAAEYRKRYFCDFIIGKSIISYRVVSVWWLRLPDDLVQDFRSNLLKVIVKESALCLFKFLNRETCRTFMVDIKKFDTTRTPPNLSLNHYWWMAGNGTAPKRVNTLERLWLVKQNFKRSCLLCFVV